MSLQLLISHKRRYSMSEQDPKQVIIDYVVRPPGAIVPNDAPPPGIDPDKWRPGILHNDGGFGAKPETIRFLQERSIPHHQLHEVIFEDEQGRGNHWFCLVMQHEQGRWQFQTGGGGGISDHHMPERSHPWVNLAGGWGREFWAGGRVHDNGHGVERVRMVAANGSVLEDIVQDGVVMFVTNQHVQVPVQVELYDHSGTIVGTHTFPRKPLPLPH